MIFTTYTASKCLNNLVEEYYTRVQPPEYFFAFDEAHMFQQHIGLIDFTKEFVNLLIDEYLYK